MKLSPSSLGKLNIAKLASKMIMCPYCLSLIKQTDVGRPTK